MLTLTQEQLLHLESQDVCQEGNSLGKDLASILISMWCMLQLRSLSTILRPLGNSMPLQGDLKFSIQGTIYSRRPLFLSKIREFPGRLNELCLGWRF